MLQPPHGEHGKTSHACLVMWLIAELLELLMVRARGLLCWS